MKLPITTHLPLELLERDPREVLDMTRSSAHGLTVLGITTFWRLLTYHRAELSKELGDAKKREGARSTIRPLSAPRELGELLSEVVPHIDFGMLPVALREIPADTPINAIFAPQKRPPLDADQIAFLRKPISAIITDTRDGAWLATTKCRTVLDIALLIVHMWDEPLDRGAVPRLRAQIEKVVGPLPLRLTMQELEALEFVPRYCAMNHGAPYEEFT